ncbi:MAG TPA: helix-hairpin-helix domain-containing protein [Gemmatimonadaceae bacterium]
MELPVPAVVGENSDVADRLDAVADLLTDQGAPAAHVAEYRAAATAIRLLAQPVNELLEQQGVAALDAVPAVGPAISRAVRDLVVTGRLAILERLRGEDDAEALLASVPGIGETLAQRLHDEYDVETLEQLEAAAHDGRLQKIAGFGPKRVAGIRDTLAQRLGRLRRMSLPREGPQPTVAELLDVDREYRERTGAGTLPRIAPRRYNPANEPWLPILHTERGGRFFTALFSNSPRAHQMRKVWDWVTLYWDGDDGERRATIITARVGPLHDRRVIRGREKECEQHYGVKPRF